MKKDEISKEEFQEYGGYFKSVAEELDSYTRELNEKFYKRKLE